MAKFNGNEVKLYAEISGGGDCAGAVLYDQAQNLTDQQKELARENIGAGTGNGTYSKPSGGIPKTDLASAVQTSLSRADTAIQPETGKGLFSGNYNDLTNKPNIPAAVTDAHINSLIDAKLNALDGNEVAY